MERSTLTVSEQNRIRVNKLKYDLGHSTVDETVEYLLEEVEADGRR
jgi:hypothetical protein